MNTLVENHIFIIDVSVGLISIIAGWILLKFPPKKINSLYGYRTKSSMKSQERWDFAQHYSAKQMIRLGVYLTLFGCIGLVYHPSETLGILIGLCAMILVFIILFRQTESALKTRFKNLS